MTGAPDPSRRRWLALSSAGAVIVLAGFLVPRLVPLPGVAAPAAGPAAGDPPPAAAAAPALNLSSTVQLVLAGTAAVGGLGMALTWLLRGRAAAAAAPGRLRVAAAVPLPYRCCVFLVEADGRPLLTGTDAGGIRTVIPLPDPEPASP